MASVVTEFTASAEDHQAVLRWRSGSESGVRAYNIQRSFDGQRFFLIESVQPAGDGHRYQFTDSDLFKERLNTYYYRIEVVMADGGMEYTPTREVTMSSSGIARTWGSIKAMFR